MITMTSTGIIDDAGGHFAAWDIHKPKNSLSGKAEQGRSQKMTHHEKPTVVLVHGAFADSSSWAGVIQRLQAAGVEVIAATNPLRGVKHDSDYVASRINQVPGPVLAVGHSYGGAVIGNAATEAKNVVGLVFVAAFAPDEGEVLGQVAATSKDAVLSSALVPLQYPGADGKQAIEFALNPAVAGEAFAADVPAEQGAVIAAIQRPVAELAFSEPSGAPAWKKLPSWAIIPTEDRAAGTDLLRSMAARAGSRVTELKGSHVIMVSQPQVVTDVILEALAGVASAAAGASTKS